MIGEYVDRCIVCGCTLRLHSLEFMHGPRITPEGFDLYNTSDGSTTNELVRCDVCNAIFPLTTVEYDEKPIGMSNAQPGGIVWVQYYKDAKYAELFTTDRKVMAKVYAADKSKSARPISNMYYMNYVVNNVLEYSMSLPFDDMPEAMGYCAATIHLLRRYRERYGGVTQELFNIIDSHRSLQ